MSSSPYEPLVTQDMIDALREWAYKGLQSEYRILRRQTVTSNPYGDDSETYVETARAWGWLKMTNKPVLVEGIGIVEALNVFRLEFPIDTDIGVGDRVAQVTDASHFYTVTDVNDEDTLQVWRECIVRRLE